MHISNTEATSVKSIDAILSNSITPLFRRVETIAEHYPESIAVSGPSETCSYGELNTAANRLAHYLIAIGGQKGNRYVVCCEPSPLVLIAILAIHKFGGVYVPVDAGFPKARVQSMVDDVSPAAILYSGDRLPDCFRETPLVTVALSFLSHSTDSYSSFNLGISVDANDLSHIFFTSGTTGKPKAVLATQGNLNHYLRSAAITYGFGHHDIFLAAAKHTFSISFFELLLPLWVGASVRPVPRGDVLDMEKLAAHFKTVTVFHIGPSLLKKVLPFITNNFSDYSAFSRMRHVSSGGDHVPPEVLELLKQIFTNAEVYVIYGSTEISCMGCTWLVPRDTSVEKTYVGRPHLDTSVRIEDESGHLMPSGEAGEILFSSPGVTQGYLNLRELTEEKFVTRDGIRYYRIGDIGRLVGDGRLQLMGRKDYQVQFHGIRIELLEIETIIRKFDGVGDVVVVGLHDEAQDELNLVAYLVLNESHTFKLQSLIDFLNNYLPDYMVPSRFVGLSNLPLNHNGKLDRSQLPEPTLQNMLVTSEYATAANDLEQSLVTLWEGLFNLQGIGVDHDFFEMGGDSLMAVQFLGKLSEQYQRFIPITALLEYPTIRGMAAILSGDIAVPEMGNVTVLKSGDNSLPPLFCLYGVFLYQDLADAIQAPNMVCGVYLQEEVDLINQGIDSDAFKAFTNVAAITEKYVDSITQYQQHGPYYLCGESFGGIIALEAAKVLEARGETVNLIAMFDTNAPGFLDSLGRYERLKKHIAQMKQRGFGYLLQNLRSKWSKMKLNLVRSLGRKGGITYQEELAQDVRVNVRHIASSSYTPEFSKHSIRLVTAKIRSEFEPQAHDLGWGRFVKTVAVHPVNGDHIGILKDDNVTEIATVIDADLIAERD